MLQSSGMGAWGGLWGQLPARCGSLTLNVTFVMFFNNSASRLLSGSLKHSAIDRPALDPGAA